MNVACFADAVTQSRLDRAATHHTAADVTVIIPAKQEARSLGGVIDRTRRYATDVLVIAGESTDGTAEVASRSGASVMADAGRGKGRAIRQAIPHIRTPVAVFLDADGSHDPEDIPLLGAPILALEGTFRLWGSRSSPARRIMSSARGCAADRASCTAGSTSSCGWPAAPSSPPASTGGSTAGSATARTD